MRTITPVLFFFAATVLYSGISQAQTLPRKSTISLTATRDAGIVVVPVRSVFQKLGAVVNYSAPPAAVTVMRDGTSFMTLKVGSRHLTVKGQARYAEVAPYLSRGHVVVPLALVKQAASASAIYIPALHTARLTERVALPAAHQEVASSNAVVTSTVLATAPVHDKAGIPWWGWFLLALLLLGITSVFLRRKREPIIHTSSTADRSEPIIKTRH